MRIALPHQRARRGDVERMLHALVELARGEALEVGALAAGDVDDLDVFAGAHEIGLSRRIVDADILQRIGKRLGQQRLVRRAHARCAGCAGGSASPYPARRPPSATPGAATINSPSRDTVNSPVSPARDSPPNSVMARALARSMPRRSSPARTERALSLVPLRICFSPARIAVAACTENGGIDGAGGIRSHKLAALHAFDIDEPQAVTGVDRHGDGASARHGVALLAGSEREDARPLDGRRPRRTWPDTLVAGKNQHFAPLFRSRVSQASGGRGPVQERRKQPIRRYCNL